MKISVKQLDPDQFAIHIVDRAGDVENGEILRVSRDKDKHKWFVILSQNPNNEVCWTEEDLDSGNFYIWVSNSEHWDLEPEISNEVTKDEIDV